MCLSEFSTPVWSKLPNDRMRIPDLDLHEVHLFRFTPESLFDEDRYLEMLSETEKERSASIKDREVRSLFIQSRVHLRTLLAHHLKMEPRDIPLVIGPHGKPSLQNGVPDFNLSHTKGVILIALAMGCGVGVDVEGIRPLRNLDRLIQDVFSPEEQRAFKALNGSQQSDRFFRGWAMKEAYVKAIGRGIAAGLSKVVLREDLQGFFAVPEGDPDHFHIVEMSSEHHKIALVYRGVARTIRTFTIESPTA